nr:MAG TPA: hypothetical protein [Caudoviricetes sp.]
MAKAATKEKENTTQSKNLMFIQKVKVNNDNTATIQFKTSNDLSAQEINFTGKDQITEEFAKSFQETVKGFTSCLPKLASESNKLTMNAIRLDYGKTDFLEKALYSVKYAFNDQNNAVINISTPLLPIYKEGMENTFCISGKDEEALHNVIAQAKAYINGETRTKQMKLVVDNTDQ